MSREECSSITKQGAPDFNVGSIVFDRYKILEYVSSGAIGRVYKALDVELKIVVALKVLISDSHTDRELMRFQSEARLASKLRHHNVATIYDFGLCGKTPYLSMEYVEGQSLQKILKSSGIPPIDEALDVLIQVCRALVHAHSQGIVHRDIKPANVVVARKPDGTTTAKILDFGVAKKLDIDIATEGQITLTGELVGSPLYMSPEQSRGEAITTRSDNYSFGCLIWCCLVGKPPIRGGTLIETIMSIQHEIPPSLKFARPDVPEELVDVVDRLLSKGPELRPELEKDVLPILERLHDQLLHNCEEIHIDSEEALSSERSVFALTEGHSLRRTNVICASVMFFFLLSIAGFVLYSQFQKTSLSGLGKMPVAVSTVSLPDELISKSRQENDCNSLAMRDADDDDVKKRLFSALVKLDLSTCKVTDDCFNYLAEQENLNELDLSHTGVISLENASRLKRLTELKLNGTDITDSSLIKLAGLKQLRLLSLSNAQNLTDDALGGISMLDSLEELDLSDTPLSFNNVEQLSRLKNLKFINVSGTRSSLGSIRYLASLPAMTKIIMSPNVLSGEQLENLNRKYPLVLFGTQQSPEASERRISRIAQLSQKINEAESKFDHAATAKHIREVLKLIPDQRSKESLLCRIRLGNSCFVLLRCDEAEGEFRNVLELADQYPEIKLAAMDGLIKVQLYRCLKNGLEPNELLSSIDQANKFAETVLLPSSPAMARRYVDTADQFKNLGQYVTAEKWYQKARDKYIALKLKPTGEDWPFFAQYYLHYADCLKLEHKLAQSVEQYRLGIEAFRAARFVPAQLYYVVVVGYCNFSAALMELGKPHEALKVNNDGFAFLSNKQPLHQLDSMLRSSRATIQMRLGRISEAKREQARANQ